MMDHNRPSYQASKSLLQAAEDGKVELVLTGLTVVNTVYVLRSAKYPTKLLLSAVSAILSLAEVASTDMPQLQTALSSSWSDYEDAVQYHAALSAGRIEYIVTSDKSGFKGSRIKVINPIRFAALHL